MKKSKKGFWVFILPALLAFIVVQVIPMFMGISYSFTDWNGVGATKNFVGLQNYITTLTGDAQFRQAFAFTFLFSICAVIMVNAVGFGLALLVTQRMKGANLLRGIFFMPNLIGGILLGFTWQFVFVQVFEAIGKAWNIPWMQGWLTDQKTGFIGLLIVVTWQLSGYMMMIYIAQIQNIPDSVIEAAKIDGATGWRRLKSIILPLMMPAFTIGLFLTISNSFKLFDQNISLTGGGPANSTQMLALNIYNTAFGQNRFGLAQSKAVVFMIVVMAISITQLTITKKREVEA
ncbi:MAG: carbohydrate ABC transporter permease [Acetatifactor sp.]